MYQLYTTVAHHACRTLADGAAPAHSRHQYSRVHLIGAAAGWPVALEVAVAAAAAGRHLAFGAGLLTGGRH
jgi:hypothetical protein